MLDMLLLLSDTGSEFVFWPAAWALAQRENMQVDLI